MSSEGRTVAPATEVGTGAGRRGSAPTPSDEFQAFVQAARDLPAQALTRCAGRTVQRMACHIAASAAEMDRHVTEYLAGRPVARTWMFEEREEPLLDLAISDVLARAEDAEAALRDHLDQLLRREPDARLAWARRGVRATGFATHFRNECALHRWDMIGDDTVSGELLSRPDLTEHTVEFLGPVPLQARGIAAGAGAGRKLSYRLRAPERPDLVVGVHRGVQELRLAPVHGDALVESDAAARHLFLWGRDPNPISRLRCVGEPEDLARLQLLLSGY